MDKQEILDLIAEIRVRGSDLDYVKQHGSINNSDCQNLLGVSHARAAYLLRKMKGTGILRMEGERRWARYYLS